MYHLHIFESITVASVFNRKKMHSCQPSNDSRFQSRLLRSGGSWYSSSVEGGGQYIGTRAENNRNLNRAGSDFSFFTIPDPCHELEPRYRGFSSINGINKVLLEKPTVQKCSLGSRVGVLREGESQVKRGGIWF